MKSILTILLILQIGRICGQEFSYPTIKKGGKTILDFVPEGWIIRDSVSGNLNDDKQRDCAVILQYKNNVPIIETEDDIADTITVQPRILIILFGEKSINKFKLVEQSNSFILVKDTSSKEDPYQSIKIEKQVLKIQFHLYYNEGSWYEAITTYGFYYQEKEFVLIGAKIYYFQRTTLDFNESNFNFLSNNWTISKGNIGTRIKPEREKFILDLEKLKTFKTFQKPYTWEVLTNIYL